MRDIHIDVSERSREDLLDIVERTLECLIGIANLGMDDEIDVAATRARGFELGEAVKLEHESVIAAARRTLESIEVDFPEGRDHMAYYHVELGYYTKRGGVALGMTVKAFGPDEASEFVEGKYLRPYKARKFGFCRVREATPEDMSLGVANEPTMVDGGPDE